MRLTETQGYVTMGVAAGSLLLNFWDTGRRKVKDLVGITETIDETVVADDTESEAEV